MDNLKGGAVTEGGPPRPAGSPWLGTYRVGAFEVHGDRGGVERLVRALPQRPSYRLPPIAPCQPCDMVYLESLPSYAERLAVRAFSSRTLLGPLLTPAGATQPPRPGRDLLRAAARFATL